MNLESVRGAVGMAAMTVRPADTSVAQALNDLPILATPTLLSIFEGACAAALAEHLGTGETSVTTDFAISVHASVGVGGEIRAHATCIDVDGQVCKFNIEVHHINKLIASGSVDRKMVDRVSFAARIAAESMSRD
jgi:fluoroacetyl-CoA thioesterase